MGYRHQYTWNAPLKDAAIKFPVWSKQVQAILREVQRRKLVVWTEKDAGDLLVQRDLVKINGPTSTGQGYQALVIRLEQCHKPTPWHFPPRCVTLGKPYPTGCATSLTYQ